MAIVYRSENHNIPSGNSTTLVINAPSGLQDGDLMIAEIIWFGTGAAPTPPSGWTQWNSDTQTWRVSSDSRAAIFYKIASSEGSTFTFTFSPSTARCGFIQAFSGVDSVNPINQASVHKDTTTGTSFTGTAITPTVDNCMIDAICARREGSATGAITSPGSYTDSYNLADTTFATREAGTYLLQTSATSTGTLTFTSANSAASGDSSIVWVFALTPANLDANTEALALTPSAVETPQLGSAGTLSLLFGISALEFILQEFGTLAFALTPSGADVAAIGDANTINFKFTPSATEPQYGLIEVTTVPLKLTPETTYEAAGHVYTDAQTVLALLVPTGLEIYCRFAPQLSAEEVTRWQIAFSMNRLHAIDDPHFSIAEIETIDPCLAPEPILS